MRLTLPYKIALLSFLIAGSGVAGVAFFTYRDIAGALRAHALHNIGDDVARETALLAQHLKGAREDVLFLTGTPPVAGIARSTRGGGYDDRENMTTALWRTRLEAIFTTILRQKPAYTSLRYIGIDDGGREIVRVDRDKDKITPIPLEALQQNKDKPYFAEAAAHPPGNVYFSNTELNREKGKITQPHQPLLRVAVPYVAETGKVFGIVIITLDFNRMTAPLAEAPDGVFFFVANEKGDYLFHPDENKRFAFETGGTANLLSDFPNSRLDLSVHPDGENKMGKASMATFRDLDVGIVLQHLHYGDGKLGKHFILGAAASFELLNAEAASLARRLLLLVLSVVAIMSLLLAWTATHLTQPIRRLTHVADQIARGEEGLTVPAFGNDEVGDLSRSWSAMLEHLAHTRQKLRTLADSLEDQVEERTADLVYANEEIKNFAYIVSHDLRSPLVNIKGFSSELRAALKVADEVYASAADHLTKEENAKLSQAIEEDAGEAMGFIETSVEKMDRLINSLLKLSRLGRRELIPEELDMTELTEEILKTMAYQIEEGGVTVKVDRLPPVTADRFAMEQILANLLANAVKYLEPKRKGLIEISGERDSHHTIYHIKDNGRGIAREDIPKAFEIFRRIGRHDTPGEGMGLPFVKTLVRMHKGRIWCESEVGRGSVFSFSLLNNLGEETGNGETGSGHGSHRRRRSRPRKTH